MQKYLYFLLVFTNLHLLHAQDLTQTVRGRILDSETQSPIAFASVFIQDTEPLLGATSDSSGYFRIENVPVGRVSVEARYPGYEPILLSNLILTSGKELILQIDMQEKIYQLDEVALVAKDDKSQTINKMSTVSNRMFSVEESRRYAGTNNDVSRMAMNFAGVRPSNDALNDIVIRGNSPAGLLWRLEGVDIPNPNHFGDAGATGGPVSMLNNNVLANSDFMSGAFPAEYGNAISGVFDLKLRNGNDEKHEFLGQVGFNGFEVGAEGPISRKSRASYLVNYRYSTLGVLQKLGIDPGIGATPNYQDLTFKLNFPSAKRGTISIFGMGGINDISFLDSEKDTVGLEPDSYFDGDYATDLFSKNSMGVLGISHRYLLSEKAYSNFTLAAAFASNDISIDSLGGEDWSNIPSYRKNFNRNRYIASFYINQKFNAANTVRAGILASLRKFQLIDSTYIAQTDRFHTITNQDGNAILLQPYIQWQHRFSETLSLNTGLHFAFLSVNQQFSPEPRISLKWELAPGQSLSAGYGLHSQMAPLEIYYRQSRSSDGSYITPNTELNFTKSQHLVIGYDRSFTPNLRIKAEAYYQLINQAIVENTPSSFSLLNQGSFSVTYPDSFNNAGSGYNYGIELTVERFLDQGFYFLSTTSLFRSRYKGSDGIERRTAFDGGYVVNLLAGKEFQLNNSRSQKPVKTSLMIDGKFTMAGGQPYTPVDTDRSAETGVTWYDDSRAFSSQLDDYLRLDLRIGFRMAGKKITQEWAFEVQNATNHKNPFGKSYNHAIGGEKTTYQQGIFPMGQYRIMF